jgi:hypothetical protein
MGIRHAAGNLAKGCPHRLLGSISLGCLHVLWQLPLAKADLNNLTCVAFLNRKRLQEKP